MTDFLTPSIASNYTYPPELKEEIATRLTSTRTSSTSVTFAPLTRGRSAIPWHG